MQASPFHPARLALLVAALFPLTGARAADADTSFNLGNVVVRDTGPLQARQLFTSVDTVDGAVVQGESVRNAWELFGRVPGMQITEFGQGTTSGKLSMRGFNGEGEVNAVKLLIDGIPSNSNDGNQPYLDLIFPLEIDSITVVRGTNDARNGLYSIAGNVDIATRRGGDDSDAAVGLGSWGYRSLSAFKGITSGDFEQNYSVATRHSNGWRGHADNDRTAFSGKWFWVPAGGGWSAGVIARHGVHEGDEPGYLGYAASRAAPSSTPAYAASDQGKRRLDQLSLHVDGKPTEALNLQAKVWWNGYHDERWVRFSQGVSQQERDTDENHTGARLGLSWRALQGLAIEGGADTERQRNSSERYLTANRARTSQTRDQDWELNVSGVFAQAVWQPLAGLKLMPGWRVDRVSGAFRDNRSGVHAPVNDYGNISQPKFGAIWGYAEGQSVYANWGRTFQIGVGSASYLIPPRTADLKPSIDDGWEVGWKLARDGHGEARVALWQQDASDEVKRRLNDPSGDSDNIGATRRRGIDLEVRTAPRYGVQGWATLALQKSEIVTPDPSAPATRGKEVDHVPRRIWSLGADWQPRGELRLSAWLRGQGSYYLNTLNNTGRWGGQQTANLSAHWQVAPAVELGAELRNLFDRYNEYVWWDGSQTLHAPAEPRSLYLTARVRM